VLAPEMHRGIEALVAARPGLDPEMRVRRGVRSADGAVANDPSSAQSGHTAAVSPGRLRERRAADALQGDPGWEP